MKYILLIFPVICFANFIPKNQVGLSNVTYLDKTECEALTNSACFKIPKDFDSEVYKISTVIDQGKPKEILEIDQDKKNVKDQLKQAEDSKKQAQENLKLSDLNKTKQDKVLEMMIKDFLKKKNIDPSDL